MELPSAEMGRLCVEFGICVRYGSEIFESKIEYSSLEFRREIWTELYKFGNHSDLAAATAAHR